MISDSTSVVLAIPEDMLELSRAVRIETITALMASRPEELRERAKKFAIRVVKLYRSLAKTDVGRILGRQLLRSRTSVAANYRAACRARSRAEFIARMGLVVEEADESLFWMELLVETECIPGEAVKPLMTESKELLSVFAASLQTAKRNAPRRQ